VKLAIPFIVALTLSGCTIVGTGTGALIGSASTPDSVADHAVIGGSIGLLVDIALLVLVSKTIHFGPDDRNE
jgi:hypothetical protein